MVIDTSAIVAIALNEPEAPSFEQRIANDPVRMISAATVLEAAMVIETRLGESGGSEFDLWLHKAGVEIVAVEPEHADKARRAWRSYGQRTTSREPQFRRLLRLRTRRADRRAAPLQGQRLFADRHPSGVKHRRGHVP
jgi:uncharacterized protein with PIN domain